MEQVDFEFKKLGKGKCAFISKTEDIERTEVVSNEYVKKHYENLKNQKREMIQQGLHLNKQMEINKVEKDEELEKFIETANRAARYNKYFEAFNNKKGVDDMLERINTSLSQIEQVIPELKRMKKK